jgi:signal transduction histidine kinase
MMVKVFISIFCFLWTTSVYAIGRKHVNHIDPQNFHHDFYAPNPYTGIFSSSIELKGDSLFEILDKGKFEAMNQMSFNSSQNTLFRYFSFRVKNASPSNGTLIWLLKNAAANRIVLYRRDANGIKRLSETGDHYKFDSRPLSFFLFAFPLELAPKEQADFILLVDKRFENLFVPFNFYSINEFDAYKSRLYLIFGGIAGALLVMLVLNVLLGISFRARIHVIYFFYILGNLFVIISYEGLDFAYIYPNNQMFSDCSRYISSAFQLAISLLLFRQYTGTPLLDASSNLQKFGLFLLVLHFAFIPISYIVFIHNNILPISRIIYLKVFSASNFLMMSFIIYDGVLKYRSGFKPAAFFIAAVSLMYIGGLEYSLNINGLISGNLLFKTIIPNTITVGMVAELIVVTIGIVYLYNRLKNQRDSFELIAIKTKVDLLNASEVYRKQERNRISDDIHDAIASRIYGLRMFTEGILNNLNNKNKLTRNLLNLQEQLDEIGIHARAVIVNLNSDGKIDFASFSSEIIRVLEDFSKSSSVKIEIGEFYVTENISLNKNQTEQILNIIREICNNINKHSKAIFLKFDLNVNDHQVSIQFKEGPIPNNPLPFKEGNGLKSITKRSQSLGGEYNQFYQDKYLYTLLKMPILDSHNR